MSAALNSKKGPKAPSPALTAISADMIIPLCLVQTQLGIGRWAMREARKKGLKTTKIGRRSFVLGADLIEFLRSQQ